MTRDDFIREVDRPVDAHITGDMLRVRLADGREIATPLAWYTDLLNATHEQRQQMRLGRIGIHWPDLDYDLSVNGMLRGNRPPQPRVRPTQTDDQETP